MNEWENLKENRAHVLKYKWKGYYASVIVVLAPSKEEEWNWRYLDIIWKSI